MCRLWTLLQPNQVYKPSWDNWGNLDVNIISESNGIVIKSKNSHTPAHPPALYAETLTDEIVWYLEFASKQCLIVWIGGSWGGGVDYKWNKIGQWKFMITFSPLLCLLKSSLMKGRMNAEWRNARVNKASLQKGQYLRMSLLLPRAESCQPWQFAPSL